MSDSSTKPAIYTFSGLQVDPTNPSYEDIRIEDIAHSLATTNRFAGHAREPISVAQHSVYVSFLVLWKDRPKFVNDLDRAGVALQALLHDASEAYLGDVTKWLKHSPAFTEYRFIENRVQRAIYRRFNLSEAEHEDIGWADKIMVRYEMLQSWGVGFSPANIQRGTGVEASYPPLTTEEIASVGDWRPWTWRNAEDNFIAWFKNLTAMIERKQTYGTPSVP